MIKIPRNLARIAGLSAEAIGILAGIGENLAGKSVPVINAMAPVIKEGVAVTKETALVTKIIPALVKKESK